MGMLDMNDLKLIGEEMGRVIDDNLIPRIEDLIDEKFDEKFRVNLEPIEARLTRIEATVVTKSYLDDKLADLKSDLLIYDRKLEKKTDLLIDRLVNRHALQSADVERLEPVRVFPRIGPTA